MKLKVEKSVYFHLFIYPVLATIILFGPDRIADTKKLLKDDMSTLFFVISVLTILVTIGYTIGILYSIRNEYTKTLKVCTRIHLTFSFINSTLTFIMYGGKDSFQITNGKTFTILLMVFFFCHYIFYGVDLLHLYEKFNKKDGFPYSERVFGVHIDTFMYIHLTVIWIARTFSLISLIFLLVIYWDKATEEKDSLLWVKLIAIIIKIFSEFNVVALHRGIRTRDVKFLQLYKPLHTFYVIAVAFSLGIQYVVDPVKNYPKSYDIISTLLLVTFMNILILERHLLYLYTRRFKQPTEIIQKELAAARIKMFMKSEKMSFLHVEIDQTDNFLGEGQFGTVRRGFMRNSTLTNFRRRGKIIAVKFLNTSFQPEEDFKSIISETRAIQGMKMGHENILKFYGLTYDCSCTGGEFGFGIVMEYCELGSLQNYLRACRDSCHINVLLGEEIRNFELWAVEIASAMQFLSNLKIIHGDLATRNVLLDARKCAKVADFGMSSRLCYYQLYIRSNQSILPWRWMAPESLLDMRFSTKSDVWSFGVLLWEMYSFGNIPWAGVEWSSDFVRSIEAGNRLQKPPLVSNQLYQNIFLGCWGFNEGQRSTFTEIKEHLQNMYYVSEKL